MNMMRPNPYLLLLGALDFSVSDLYANRRGELSAHQREQLQRQSLHEIELAIAGLIALIVCGIAFEVRLIVVVFGAACLFSVILAVVIRFEEDAKGVVRVVSGRPEFKPAGRLPFLRPYQLRVDSEDFLVSRPVMQAFDQQHRYRLYYAPGSRTIVSAEVAA